MDFIEKERFAVIGREGSSRDGAGFVGKLWEAANAHFGEIAALVKQDADGVPAGFWGAMSDFSRRFLPWEENFSQGLYLAGAEVNDAAQAPEGWVKWTLPASRYLRVKVENGDVGRAFADGLAYLAAEGLSLVGAAYDYNCPRENGQGYVYFPVERL